MGVWGLCVQWRWARAHADVDITGEGGALATRKRSEYWRPAVCGEVLRAEGEAYAEFTWVRGDSVLVGVARAGVDPSSVGNSGLFSTADGRMYGCYDGAHCHNHRSPPWAGSSSRDSLTDRFFGTINDAPRTSTAASSAGRSLQTTRMRCGGGAAMAGSLLPSI